MKKTTIFLIFLFSLCTLHAQNFTFDDACKNIYNEILCLRFDGANKLIAEKKETQPDNLSFDLLENYIDFLTLFISEDRTEFEKRAPNKDIRLQNFDKLSDKDPNKRWAKGLINLQWAFARLKFDEKITAAWEIRRAFLLFAENEELFPNFTRNMLEMGVLHSVIGAIPERYQWIVKLASMHGSINQGCEELYSMLALTQNDLKMSYLRKETLFYLSFIEMNLMVDKSHSEQLLYKFTEEDLESPLLVDAKANLEMRLGKNDDAIETLALRTNEDNSYPFFLLDYLDGQTRLRKLDFEAKRHYEDFLANYKGKNFLSDAKRKCAWIALLSGNEQTYRALMEEVKSMQPGMVDIDKQAYREATSGEIPNVDLLKAQLLFDGGYYESALQTIENKKFNSARYNLEQKYRLGRIMDALHRHKEALAYYDKTIEEGKNEKYYFAANAALKSAEFYELNNNPEKAELYFEKCLEMNPNEYKVSIHQKAKLGLERLENMRK